MGVRTIRYITPLAPDHQGGGGHRRLAHVIDELARRWEVELVVADELRDDAIRASVASVLTVPPLHAPSEPSLRRRARDLRLALVGPDHREVELHATVRADIEAHLAGRPEPDVVCVELAALARLVPSQRTAHWVLTLHNLGSVMAAQRATVAPSARERWLERRDAVHARHFERWVVDAYDTLVVVTDEDAATLGACSTPPLVVPNGVAVDDLHVTPLPTGPHLVLVGALYTRPNEDGAAWFCTEVLPHIRAHVPDATVAIVGLRPTARVRALAELPGVEVHADVPAVEPYLEAARVAVVPLRVGSGSRLKALEAMAAGRPVVGTVVGLGGLAIEPGRHALVADDPEGFAAASVRLLQDDALAGSLARAGRALVEARYGWPAIAAAYADALSERVESGRRWPRS